MSDPSHPDDPRPVLTERDLSFNIATAGAEAKDAAAKSGGDPADLRSLVGAALSQSAPLLAVASSKQPLFRGLPLREDDLLVTICLSLYEQLFGSSLMARVGEYMEVLAAGNDGVNEPAHLEAMAACGYIFTMPEEAWDMLDQAADKTLPEAQRSDALRDFRRSAMDVGGRAGQADLLALCHHLARLARRIPPAGNAAAPEAS